MRRARIIVLTLLITTMALVSISTDMRKIEPVVSVQAFSNEEAISQVAEANETVRQATLKAAADEETRIAKEKADALAAEKVKQNLLDKQAADNAKVLAAKKAEASKLAQINAAKAKQADIDRIAAERADKAKQDKIKADFIIAKEASDKAAADKEAARVAKIELLKVEKTNADALVKAATDTQAAAVQEVDKAKAVLATAVQAAKEATDKLAVAKAAGNPVTDEEQAKAVADQAVIAATDKLAVANETVKVANDKLAAAVQFAKDAEDRLEVAEVDGYQTVTGVKLAAYLSSADNISSVLNRAVVLHNGDPSNTCVYFSSEAMRRIGMEVPIATCNTKQYLAWLKQIGWVSSYDISKLTPGTICFTTNDWAGYPTHTFVFMSWVNSGDHTWANVADNQGNAVHVRNMGATEETDAFAFYMHN